jgi:hypothetical protein
MRVVDIKCTSKAEKDWPLQVGGLTAMLEGDNLPIYRDSRFRYFNDNAEQFMSISGLLREVGLAKSFAGMEFSSVVLHAIERGKVMESCIFSGLSSKTPERISIPEIWKEELTTIKTGNKTSWVQGYWNWLSEYKPEGIVLCRKFVSDSECRVAGEIDLILPDKENAPPAVLHLNPAFAKGFIFREYPDAREQWECARAARIEALEAFKKARIAIEKSSFSALAANFGKGMSVA